MTLRTKTLTAALALTLTAGGFALAQEAAPVPAPPVETQEPGGGTPVAPAPTGEVPPADPVPEAQEPQAPAAGTPAEVPQIEAPAAQADVGTPAAETPAVPGETAPEAPAAEAEDVVVQNPAASQPEVDDDAVAVSEGGESAVPVETVEGVVPVEGHTEIEGEAAEEAGGHGDGHIEDVDFSFEGPLGSFDQFQLQRGLQIYTEVCSACHGLKFVPIRTLADESGPGLPEDQVRAYAAELLPIFDDEIGEERVRTVTDNFPTVSGGGMGPDLSLMAKARAGFHGPFGLGINQLVRGMGGPEYIHAVLTGYTGEEQEQAGTLLYGNTAFPGGWISMAPPLSDDQVTYEDGTPATVDQMAMDVSAFLMWTAEPKMMDRKSVGLVAVLFLLVLTVLLYLTNKRIWAPHKVKKAH